MRDEVRAGCAAPLVWKRLAFVIPVFNEKDTLRPLVEGIIENAEPYSCRILLVDDGSSDGSTEVLRDLHAKFPCVDVIRFDRNLGKTAALSVAFSCLNSADQGPAPSIVFTMDADLQDDPREIPRFIAAMQGGADLVVGWKKVRRDPWHKTLPSRIYNKMVSGLFRVRLHDVNCGFKAFRPEIAQRIHLYGDLHRLIPILAGKMGCKVAEIPVHHQPRRFGASKYGVGRFFKGLYYVLSVFFFPDQPSADYSRHVAGRLFHTGRQE